MLTLIFTPRESAVSPVQIGPVARVRIEGNTMRNAETGTVIAECHNHQWIFGGKPYYRADCAGPVTVGLEGRRAVPAQFGPFKHFSLYDGMVYVDRAVFAQLKSSNDWYVERLNAEYPGLLLQP